MLVTASLASGAVREAARSSSAAAREMRSALERKGIQAPEMYRRFDEWFRRHCQIYEHCALLIAFGKIGRRRGAFSAFMPSFREEGSRWDLNILQWSIKFSPGYLEQLDIKRLPVTISGHALERMFQRTGSIQWSMVRDCLADAALILNAAAPAYIGAGCKQCALPAEKGLLVGQIVEGKLALRTFLPELELQSKWQMLLSDLKNFPLQHKLAVETSALTSDDDAANALKTLLSLGKYKWLFDPYSPGLDPLDRAWRSKETAAGFYDLPTGPNQS